MKRILGNFWIQLILGLIAGIIGTIVSGLLAIIFGIQYGGLGILGGGDKSPITFAIAAVFSTLTFIFPTLVWFFLNRFENLKLFSKGIKVVTFILFATIPLWIYFGWETFSKLQIAYGDYRSIRDGCVIQDGVNRRTIGKDTYEFECKNGIYDGFTKTYNSQGIIVFEGSYLDGKLDGTQTTYYDDGKVRRTYNYKNGNQEGTEIFYNEDGSTSLYIINGRQVYYQIPEKYPDGDLDLESQNFFCENHGKDSVKNYSYTCLNNVINSEFINYDSKGNVLLRVKITNGMLDGIYEWFIDGKPYTYLEFRNGKLEGKVKGYSIGGGGELVYEGQYINGLQYGIFRMYDYKGNVLSDVVFENGQLVKINK